MNNPTSLPIPGWFKRTGSPWWLLRIPVLLFVAYTIALVAHAVAFKSARLGIDDVPSITLILIAGLLAGPGPTILQRIAAAFSKTSATSERVSRPDWFDGPGTGWLTLSLFMDVLASIALLVLLALIDIFGVKDLTLMTLVAWSVFLFGSATLICLLRWLQARRRRRVQNSSPEAAGRGSLGWSPDDETKHPVGQYTGTG